MLQSALGVGLMTGPIIPKNPRAQPFYTYNIHGYERVQYAIAAMWPWLSQRRRQRAMEVLILARESSSGRRSTSPEGHQRNRDGLHCSNGHEYTEENTHYDKDNKPHCRICARDRRRNDRRNSKCKDCDKRVVTAGYCSGHYELYQVSLGNLCNKEGCVRGATSLGLCSLHYKQSRRDPTKIAHADKTHCPQGHEYTEENTYVSKRGSRTCRTCQKEAQVRYQNKKKGL